MKFYCSICHRPFKHNAEPIWEHFDKKHKSEGHPIQKVTVPLEGFFNVEDDLN